jgi:hypothetical protein
MTVDPIITLRRLRLPNRLETDVRARLAKLERYCASIISARVLVEPVAGRQRADNHYRVRIDLTVPRGVIVVSHEASLRPTLRAGGASSLRKQDEADPSHRYLSEVIREAFEVTRRQLQDYTRRRRGAVKAHSLPRDWPRPATGGARRSDRGRGGVGV